MLPEKTLHHKEEAVGEVEAMVEAVGEAMAEVAEEGTPLQHRLEDTQEEAERTDSLGNLLTYSLGIN